MILGENGIKMGKRYPEFAVNPSDIVRDYGADTLRLYEMFMGPLEASKPWSKQGVEGARRFLARVWNYFTDPANITKENDGKLTKIYHQTVKKVTNDFEELGFNTAISQMMIFLNTAQKEKCPLEYAEGYIKMLSCIAPHIGEEIWAILHGSTVEEGVAAAESTLAFESWPTYDEELTKEDTIEIGVQVNGKVKGTVELTPDEEQESAVAKALEVPNIAKNVEGKNIVKVIYVKGKILNLIAK